MIKKAFVYLLKKRLWLVLASICLMPFMLDGLVNGNDIVYMSPGALPMLVIGLSLGGAWAGRDFRFLSQMGMSRKDQFLSQFLVLLATSFVYVLGLSLVFFLLQFIVPENVYLEYPDREFGLLGGLGLSWLRNLNLALIGALLSLFLNRFDGHERLLILLFYLGLLLVLPLSLGGGQYPYFLSNLLLSILSLGDIYLAPVFCLFLIVGFYYAIKTQES